MTKPNDIPQDVWDKATEYFGDLIEKDGSIPFMTPHEIAARAIMKAKEDEREDIWEIASGNATARRELERRAMEAGDAEGCLLHALLASENDQIADAILNRKLANNTNKD